MKVKCIPIVLIASVFTGCASIEQASEYAITPVATETVSVATQTPQYDPVALKVPEIETAEYSVTLEAEEADVLEGCTVTDSPRAGYSGEGYITGLGTEDEGTLSMTADLPTTQHYDITIVAATSAVCTCKIMANGETVYTLILDSSENFVRISVQGIFLAEGEYTFEFVPMDGIIDIDCMEITNNTSLYEDEAKIEKSPVNENASDGAVELYSFLRDNYGEKMITGQYVSSPENTELEEIYAITGKYPLIRFDDIAGTLQEGVDAADVVDACLDWADRGGIVGLCWYWESPSEVSSIYAAQSSFSLSDAITEEDVAFCNTEALEVMEKNGDISSECVALIADIDAISEALMLLCEADVPVLWRPLMEAGGGWYWWGSNDPEEYVWLWDLVYTRMVEYHELNNLIWVWNGQSANYLVPEEEYDIASLDLYVDEGEEFGSRYEQYVAVRNMVVGKMIGISECSGLPDMNALFRDNAVWGFFGLWYDPYFSTVSEDDLITVYNSEASLVLEE